MIQDAWKNFEMSGKISDYLIYREASMKNEVRNPGAAAVFSERGRNGYEGESGSDGDGAACHADGRI